MLLSDLRVDARYHISPQLTTTEYPDVVVERNINRWYQKILSWIIPEQGEWEINGDILTIDLEEGVTDYEIPVTFLRIFKAEIMYHTGGKFVPAQALSIQRNQDIAFGNDNIYGSSEEYPTIEVFGNYFQISPAPTEQVVNGFKVWAQLSFDELSETDSVVLPDIPDPVQRVLAYGAAFDYCLAEEMYNKANAIKKIIFGDTSVVNDQGLKGEIVAMFSTRTGNRRDRLTATNRRRNWR